MGSLQKIKREKLGTFAKQGGGESDQVGQMSQPPSHTFQHTTFHISWVPVGCTYTITTSFCYVQQIEFPVTAAEADAAAEDAAADDDDDADTQPKWG